MTISVIVYHLIDVGRGRGGVRAEFLSLRVQRYSVHNIVLHVNNINQLIDGSGKEGVLGWSFYL
jgi:hypothetical protein